MPRPSITEQIISHPDKDELISKMLQSVSSEDIHQNLKVRYGDVDKQYVLSVKTLETFKKNSLNIYQDIYQDLHKTSNALRTQTPESLDLSIKSSSQYKKAMLQLANNELDIKTMLGNLILSVENRIAQITDLIQRDPENIDTRSERLLTEYIDRLTNALEKWHKYILLVPDHVSQVNVSVQHINQQTTVFYEAIRNVLARMDIEASLLFMELFKEEMDKIKEPQEPKIIPVEERFAEVKSIHTQISHQLADGYQKP